MTSMVSVRLDNELLKTMRTNARFLHLSQTDYIRQAIENLNKLTGRQIRKKQLTKASLRVRRESMKVNKSFDEFERDI